MKTKLFASLFLLVVVTLLIAACDALPPTSLPSDAVKIKGIDLIIWQDGRRSVWPRVSDLQRLSEHQERCLVNGFSLQNYDFWRLEQSLLESSGQKPKYYVPFYDQRQVRWAVSGIYYIVYTDCNVPGTTIRLYDATGKHLWEGERAPLP